RMAYLLATGLFAPHQILAVTFTNKAAGEMSQRVADLIGGVPNANRIDALNQPAMGTFHSICARLLRKDIARLGTHTAGFSIFDEDDSLKGIKQIIKDLNIDREISPSYARSLISAAKNRRLNISDLGEDVSFNEIYEAYQKLLVTANALDFDDLLLQTVILLERHPDVLDKYQDKWPYILVDEYQDTNNIQYQLIKLLVADSRNIFAVGDDAQSIYGFRGANYQNILNFEKDFPDSTVYTLDQNYRSTGVILSAANEIIKLSPNQKEKNLWTANSDGPRIVKFTAIDETAEAMFVAGEIQKLAKKEDVSDEPVYVPEYSETPFFDRMMGGNKNFGRPAFSSRKIYGPAELDKLKDIAILYRTNAQSRALEEVLLQFGIPYHLVGSVRFYERLEIKDALAYLRLVQNDKDPVSLARIVNVPARGIGEKSLDYIRRGELEALTKRAKEAWQNFQVSMQLMRNTAPEATVVDLIDVLLKKFNLQEHYEDGTKEGESRWENVKELMTVASRFNHLPWHEGLEEFLSEVALYSATDEVGSNKGVTLMTLHQAKGLEFETVFIVGMEEGILPHSRSLEPGADVTEEIRLAYVGVTRARRLLYLTNAYVRRIYGTSLNLKPSRILRALPEELVEERDSFYEF
ncbi:MAG TPA: UvrD-helicase domain-containing protein, partial [Flavobacterium sp.]|nr:UvrD-helicase domain-containing protein [Flavobacterium sp.]